MSATTAAPKNFATPPAEAALERIVNDSPRVFSDADFPVGSVAHQGDLILVRIEGMPAGSKPRRSRQMAIGDTQGARHVLKKGNPRDCQAAAVVAAIASVCPGSNVSADYVGPVFATAGGAADLLHPEHGDHHYRGEMTIAVVYQRNLDAEERERRVID